MQFGRFRKIFRFERFFLVMAFGATTLSAQGPQFGQALGNAGNQSGCIPTDPGCQANSDQGNNQINDQIRIPNQGNQQPLSTQGVVLPGQGGSQQNANASNANRNQRNELNREYAQPLEPPTEFQQNGANSTGKMLPIYGTKLFRNPPSTFAPLDMVPVTPDYVIGTWR